MDIETVRPTTTGDKISESKAPTTLQIKSNLYGVSMSSMVFQYRLIENTGKPLLQNERFRELILKEIGWNTPETIVNKLLDLENGIFYSLKMFNSLHFRALYDGVEYDFQLKYEGNLENNYNFFRCLFMSLLYKSQMIEIDEYTVNPFDIKETEGVSLIPAFKFDFIKLDAQHHVSVTCEMLFAPKVSVFDLIETLMHKGITQAEIERTVVGKLVQTTYQSWSKYFKITKILFGDKLSSIEYVKFGQSYILSEYFAKKYPFIKIRNPHQFLVLGIPVNNRFETIKEQREKPLIPELLEWIISNEDLIKVHGVDYFESCRINKRTMNYFYINKFISSFTDKPAIQSELRKWRVLLDKNSLSLGFQMLEFQPTLGMNSPKGLTQIERNLLDQDKEFFTNLMENRAFMYTSFTEIIIAYPIELSERGSQIVQEVGGCLEHFKYTQVKPESLVISTDTATSWKQSLESRLQKVTGQPATRILLCLTKDRNIEHSIRYELLRRNEIFKVQSANLNEEFKYDCFKAHHTLLQLNQLIGGQPWYVQQLEEKSPIVVASAHLQQVSEHSYLLVFTLSWNKYFTKYITKCLLISDATSPTIVTDMKEFFSKCCDSMFKRQNISALDFSLIVYLSISQKTRLFSSFDRELNLQESLRTNRNKKMLQEGFKQSIGDFGAKSFVAIEITHRKDVSFFPSTKGVAALERANLDYYSDFAHYKESRDYLFGSFPECLHLNYNNQTRFLLVSRHSLGSGSPHKIVKEEMVNEFEIIHSVNINEATVKKWVLTSSILYGCVDYENPDRYVSLPVSVVLGMRTVAKLAPRVEDITDQLVRAFNVYTGQVQLT